MSISGHARHDTGVAAGPFSQTNGNGHDPLTEQEEIAFVRQLRHDVVAGYREQFRTASSPIRTMARMMNEVHATARKAGISAQVLKHELVNRTIGDVNVRMITERVGGVDY